MHISFFYLKCCLIIFDERPHHFGKYTKIFGNAFKVDLVLGKVFISFWHSLHVFGQIFIAVNCQISKTQSGCYYFTHQSSISLIKATWALFKLKMCIWASFQVKTCIWAPFKLKTCIWGRFQVKTCIWAFFNLKMSLQPPLLPLPMKEKLFGSLYLNSNVKENKLKKRSGWAHIQQWII